jgi:hypothetical protein
MVVPEELLLLLGVILVHLKAYIKQMIHFLARRMTHCRGLIMLPQAPHQL